MNCIKGWGYRIENVDSDDNKSLVDSTPVTRRGRISRSQASTMAIKPASDKIVLIRQVDGVEFKVGDAIEVTSRDKNFGLSLEICIIKQIQWGTSEFILVHVVWLLRPIEVSGLQEGIAKENELFLTPYFNELKYTEFIRHINVLSEDQFNDIVIDESNSNNTFLLRRLADDYGNLSESFDYLELHQLLLSNNEEFTKKIMNMSLSHAQNRKSSRRARQREQPIKTEKGTNSNNSSTKLVNVGMEKRSGTKTENKRIDLGAEEKQKKKQDEQESIEPSDSDLQSDYISDDHDPDVESEDEEVVIESEEEVEDDEADLDEEESDFEEYGKKRKKRTRSPRKNNTPSPKRKSVKSKTTGSELEEFYSAVTPTKKIKFSTLDRSSLPVFLSPTKRVPDGFTDTTSQAFKEMKQKLHTSQKLNALPGREDEFAMIYMNLESAVNEGTGCCVYVSGVPGMGKTATIKDVVQQMTESQSLGEIKPFSYVELNGLKLLNPNVAYEVLWEHISGHRVVATNAALLLEEYFKTDQANRKPLIVLMDELDQIATKKQNVMYNFFNWPTYNTSKLIVIAVANTMDLPERVLSNKISSRLGLRRIQFKGYTFPQLGDIISHRLEMITKNNRRKVTISPDAIGFASRKVASVSGDARRALNICRRAVEIAEKQYYDNHKNLEGATTAGDDDKNKETYEVLISHILAAINETVNSPLAQFIAALPFASKLVLASMLRTTRRTGLAESKLGDIISEMKNSLVMSTDPKQKKPGQLDIMDMLYTDKLFGDENAGNHNFNLRIHSFKHVVTSLVEAGIIALQTSAGERSKLVQLNVSEEEVVSVLKKDNQIAGFL